jgi:hypothetical protein
MSTADPGSRKQRKLRGKVKSEMQRGIGYFRKNRQRMRYDEYHGSFLNAIS